MPFAFCQILLHFEDIDEALKLLDQSCSEGIQPDLLLYNTILQAASEKVICYSGFFIATDFITKFHQIK